MRTWIEPIDRTALVAAVLQHLSGGAIVYVEGDIDEWSLSIYLTNI